MLLLELLKISPLKITTAQNARTENHNTENRDEIEPFLNVRYASAKEICWKLFKKDLQDHFPSFKRLDIDLPLKEAVYTLIQMLMLEIFNFQLLQQTVNISRLVFLRIELVLEA